MIIHHDTSNILDVKEGVIVHGCNCQGVMGSGVAKQLRSKYPDIFLPYAEALEQSHQMDINPIGGIICVRVTNTLIVINALTQQYYGRDGNKYVSYKALQAAMEKVADRFGIDVPIHIPYLIGAGLGGGDEEKILRIIETKLKEHEVHLHHWK